MGVCYTRRTRCSQLVAYFKVATNNRPETVFFFLSAVQEYGLLSRISMDCGGENIAVAEFILEHPQCGVRKGSVTVN